MKKGKKIVIFVLGAIIGLILVDSIQALIFNNKPVLKLVKVVDEGNLHQISKGILVDNYVCVNGTKKTVFKWKSDVCSNEYIYVQLSEETNIKIEDKKVNLRVKEGTQTESRLTVILENNSDEEICYGSGYGIQKEFDGKWYSLKVNGEYISNAMLYCLLPNNTEENGVSFDNYSMYGKFTPGKYRVVKAVELGEEKIYVAAEFIID